MRRRIVATAAALCALLALVGVSTVHLDSLLDPPRDRRPVYAPPPRPELPAVSDAAATEALVAPGLGLPTADAALFAAAFEGLFQEASPPEQEGGDPNAVLDRGSTDQALAAGDTGSATGARAIEGRFELVGTAVGPRRGRVYYLRDLQSPTGPIVGADRWRRTDGFLVRRVESDHIIVDAEGTAFRVNLPGEVRP